MPVSSTTSATGVDLGQGAPAGTNPNGILKKDDFLKLLLVELQHQDPTEPMDSAKILSQTSQLATLEASENTNKALSNLASSLVNNQQFSTIASIGKIADLGNDKIAVEKDREASFDLYFPSDVTEGTIEVADAEGTVVQTITVGENKKGVYNFGVNGLDEDGNRIKNLLPDGIYSINAKYTDPEGTTRTTRLGAYPIESVRFEQGQTLVKLGSSYVPFESIKEVYNQ